MALWQEYTDNHQTSKEYIMSLAREAAGPPSNDNTDNNGSGSIGIMIGVVIGSVASTVLVGALIALLVFGIRKAKSVSKSKRLMRADTSSKAYLVINDDHGSTSATNSAV